VLAAVFLVPTAGKAVQTTGGPQNTVGMPASTSALLQKIMEHGADKTAVIAMGNPYLAADFPAVQTYLCTFSNATVSEASAVKALVGEMPIHGHLPVTIPNIAPRGAGMERPQQALNGGSNHAEFKTAAH